MADGVHRTPRAPACARAIRSRKEEGGMADCVHPHAASPRTCPRDTLERGERRHGRRSAQHAASPRMCPRDTLA